MNAVKRELEKTYERWFPFLDSEDDKKVREGFQAWIENNHVEAVLSSYQIDEELLKKCMKVLLINLEDMEPERRAVYLKLYRYQEDVMRQVRIIWSHCAERHKTGEFISEDTFRICLHEFFEKYWKLMSELRSESGCLDSDLQSLASDILLDLEYARGKTEQKSHWLSERLE